MAPAKPIAFLVPGQEQPPSTRGSRTAGLPAGALRRGRVKHAVRVVAARGGEGMVRVEATPGEDVVVLQIAGGPELVLHPENARDLLQAQRGASPRSARAAGAQADGDVVVPIALQWSGMAETPAARGVPRGAGGVVLSAVHVLTGVFEDDAADLVASEVVKRVDGQVEAGLYHLSADELPPLKGRPRATGFPAVKDGSPLLVLVHGTFSTTAGTFGKFWINHPEHVRSLFKRYDDRVYGLDHPTLGVSPIANALTLAEALPPNAHVHLLTHSRGGLVAEVLARVCASRGDDFTEFAGKAYQEQRTQLQALAALVKKKGIRVDRVVRVACPARGTLLASKRVDAYVSVFKWTLELAGIPVAAELLDFLNAVAQRRADPGLMPGLAAQIPDSPLVRWLHAVDQQIDGELRVISGDLQGDSISSWLKTLLTDAFYWTDHDLVVQTRSMYGGSPRRAASTFVLDQGGKVTHFNYFSNDRTARAITNALLQDAPQDFSLIGPLSWSGQSATGTRARIARPTAAAGERPAVFLLPGMFGSNLKVGADRVWVSWRLVNGLEPLAYAAGKADKVQPDGLIGSMYGSLSEFLSATHDVTEFPYDWRRPIEDEARRLATAVTTALDARRKTGQPVRIVAHSMGGLVARTLQLEQPAVWKRMLSHEGARILMLGTPNAGSFAPMQVLSGDDNFGNLLAMVGAPFREHDARSRMAQFPGFLQLQAGLLDPEQSLSSAKTWQKLADDDFARAKAHAGWHQLPIQLEALRWGVPPQRVLDAAIALRRRLNDQRQALEASADHLLLVVGHAPFTPERFEVIEQGLVYAGSPDGDGRVTLEAAMLPGVRTWRVPCDHGQLPDRKEAFVAYRELLEKGTTSLIESVSGVPAARAGVAAASIYARPSRAPQKANPPRAEEQALETTMTSEPAAAPAAGAPLRVTVHNGDLTFVRYPLLLGHYQSMRLTGTEYVMDRWIGHAMEQSLQVGTYPDAVGTNRIFINRKANPHYPFELPRPEAVIVVGLGEEAKLRGTELVRAVRQAVLAWAERQAESRGTVPVDLELATTLIGSGGSGISAGQSAQLVAQGVYEANLRLAQEQATRAADADEPVLGRVSRLHIIELYLDRASEALRALHLQADATPGRLAIDAVVEVGTGAMERTVDASYRGADYDYISALTHVAPDAGTSIEYTLDTRRARTEVRAQHTQSTLLGHLVALASNDANTDTRIGRTLFQLLVPIEIEPYLAGSTEMQIEVDSGTAGIPWELLDTDRDVPGDGGGGGRRPGDGGEPWAIRTKLLRKLRVDNPPLRRDAGADGSALVIGEPKCDPAKYPRLYGARAEAQDVAGCLAASAVLGRERVEGLISPDDPQQFGADARQVLNALFDRDRTWRIVHIAGHGEPAEGKEPGGVVLSDGFLGAREIAAMRVVPELVFVNCCHLAARSGDQLLHGTHNRARFAAGVAEELITVGVRCVIAAGWAVDDAAASAFATTFYAALLGGSRFLDAVGSARKAARTHGGNTWAAYQCYGDPDWTFRRDVSDAQRPSLEDQYQGVLSASSLERAVSMLAIQSEFQGASPELQRDKLRFLEERARQLAPDWLRLGSVAEAFATASAAANDLAGAIRWYGDAVAASDGTASLKAAEQLANLRARVAGEAVEAAHAAVLAHERGAGARLDSAIAAARTDIADAIASLERLVALHPTLERQSFLGSATKRLAMIEAVAGNEAAELAAIAAMERHYRRAEELQSEDEAAEFYYPALNYLAADAALNAGTAAWTGPPAERVTRVRAELEARATANPDFWSIVGQTELQVYEALASRDLAGMSGTILAAWRDLHSRVPLQHKWKSVYDTARMVLSKYAARVDVSERKAAEHLLEVLAEMAGVGAPAMTTETPVPRAPRARRAPRSQGRKKADRRQPARRATPRRGK